MLGDECLVQLFLSGGHCTLARTVARTQRHKRRDTNRHTLGDWHPKGPCNPLGCNLCLCAARLVQILNFLPFQTEGTQFLRRPVCCRNVSNTSWGWTGPRSKVKWSRKGTQNDKTNPGKRRREIFSRFPLWHEHVIRRQSNQKTTKCRHPAALWIHSYALIKAHLFCPRSSGWNRPTAFAHLHKIHFEAKWGTVGDQMSELLSGICSRGSFSFFLPSRVCVSFRAVQRGVIPQ